MKNVLLYLLITLSISVNAQKTEKRIIHISGDDTLIMEMNGMTGDIDSLIEKTLKSFYKIEGEDGFNQIDFSFDSLFTKEMDIRMEKDGSSTEKDSVKIKLGKMNIVIIEDKEIEGKPKKYQDRKIIIDKAIQLEDQEKVSKNNSLKKSNDNDFTYWAGLSYGVNGMLNTDGKFTTESDADFLQFDYAKSYEIQFNVLEKRFPILNEYIGVSTGLGFKWNRFTIENNGIEVNYNDTLLFTSANLNPYKRSTLRSAYIQAPILFEFSSNKNQDKAWHLSVGVVGGLRIGSSWRTKTGNDVTNIKGDFNFRPFTASALAMIGYNDISLYLNYGLSDVFDKNAAPKTRVVSAGVFFNF
jgi:hypothetical protein